MKLEFLDGQIWAMSGGTPAHARITMNVGALLTAALRDRRCSVYSPDLRVRSKITGLATYADVAVVCERAEIDPEDPTKQTILNPVVLVEVLSPSTEEYDHGDKLVHYQTIPTVNEIVLVASEKHDIELVRREADGSWSRRRFGEGDVVALASIGCSLAASEIYRDPLAGD